MTYDVYPCGLTYHRGSLYLVGRAPRHDESKRWILSFAKHAVVLELAQFRAEIEQELTATLEEYAGTTVDEQAESDLLA
ncbi:MAG: WCX domain-containing protein [Thermoguttaceae bacterium]